MSEHGTLASEEQGQAPRWYWYDRVDRVRVCFESLSPGLVLAILGVWYVGMVCIVIHFAIRIVIKIALDLGLGFLRREEDGRRRRGLES